MQCVILAGGLGTRLAPLSNNIPKSLIEVNGLPFINYQLMWLTKHNIKNIVICIGHLGQMIRNYVQDGSRWNLSVSYVDEGENLLGTAGALKLALNENKLSENFITIYGDSFLPINIADIYNYYIVSGADCLMTIFKNKNELDKSNVILHDNYNITYDKNLNNAIYIDYGLSILKRRLIELHVPSYQKYDLSTFFNHLSLQKEVIGYEVFERFFEIGSFDGLKDFKIWLGAHPL